MDYLILLLLIAGFFYLVYKTLDYLKATRGTEGYARRKIFSTLFMAFIALIGITSVFADALFEFLDLDKPAQFEWLSFAAFAILAYAGVRIVESGRGKGSSGGAGEGGDNVGISGSKNINIGNIKSGGDVHIGDKYE